MNRVGRALAPSITGLPESVADLRFPQNAAWGFPAPRSLELFPQHGDSPQLSLSNTTQDLMHSCWLSIYRGCHLGQHYFRRLQGAIPALPHERFRNANPPSRLCPPHIRPSFPYRYRTLKILAFSSSRTTSYAISVRLASALPVLPSDSTSQWAPLPSD